MNRIILADSQAIFRTGAAKILAVDGDFRITAQCSDAERMMHAVATFPHSIVLFASLLKPEPSRLKILLESTGCRGIVIAENADPIESFLQQGMHGVVYRNVTAAVLVECVRHVSAGGIWAPQQAGVGEISEEDMVGLRVRERLTPKELRIAALIVQGCKNREIAHRLKTTEQVIKNYLRSIYDKTGVSDRLELALFILHHRVLAQAAAEMSSRMEAEDLAANSSPSPSTPHQPQL